MNQKQLNKVHNVENVKITIERQLLSLSGIACMSSITFPFQMIRTRLQTTHQLIRQGVLSQPYTSVFDCVSKIKTGQGIRAFWKGNFANVLRVIPNEAFNYSAKQSIHLWIKKKGFGKDNQIVVNFLAGSIGAIFTLIFIYPMDFARNKLSNDIKGKGSIKRYLVDTYKLQGIRGIYRGSVNFFISSAIFRAFYFGVFDSIKAIAPNDMKTRMIGSYVGSLVAIYSVYPFDTVRKRMMMTSGHKFKYNGFFDCIKQMIKNQGFKSIYTGWQLSILQGFGAASCLFFLDIIGTDIKKKSGIE